MVLEVKFKKKHGGGTFGTFQRVIAEGGQQTVTPTVEGQKNLMLFLRDGTAEFFVRAAVACIDAIITNHLEIRFRNVADKPFHEIQYWNGLVNKFVVFVPVVVESNRITIVLVDAGSGDSRTPKISADIFGDDGRITKVGFSIDIKTILLITVNRGFDFLERVTNPGMHFIKECGLKRFPEQFIVEVFKGTPTTGITNATFGNKTVNVRIPFKVTSKSMQDTDEAGSKTFRFVLALEHSEDNTADSREKTVKQCSVSKKKRAKFFRNGKNTVSVRDIKEFEGHGSSSVDGVFYTTSGAEAAVAAERYKFERSTGRASVHGTAKGGIPTMNHFFNILDNSLAGMKNIYHFFIMVCKNVL